MNNFSYQERLEKAFANLPVLRTPRLLLRKLCLRDDRDMFRYTSDPQVSRYVLWDTHRTLRDTRASLRSALRQYRLGKPSSFAIVRREDARMIGTVTFVWVDCDNRSAELGYSLARDCWNQGYATEAVEAALRFGFTTLGLHRIEAQHIPENAASGRVMEKCGLKREGLLRQRVWCKERFEDIVLYAIIEDDWRKAHMSPQKEDLP